MFSEEKRGNWFSNRSTSMLHTSSTYEEIKSGIESDFFIINEQEGHLIKVCDVKQIELLKYCMYGYTITKAKKDWLINDSKLKFFDSVEAYVAFSNMTE
ncbi:hypothetical protein [Paenibacillus dendritiformis]|uniref:hypothetical protein n=1 Tax=Paenibacillus dendritiformis TaxID=130049 RepID=UPI00387E0C19